MDRVVVELDKICPRGQVLRREDLLSVCWGEEMAVFDVELKSGWPKVRAERTVRCILV